MIPRHHTSLLVLLLFSAVVLYRILPDAGGNAISGIVFDDGRPVAGAIVRIKGDFLAVRTDAAGRFLLSKIPRSGDRITAWKEGYFIAGASADQSPLALTLQPLPAEDHEDYRWIDPHPDPAGEHSCGNCHGEIFREWQRSGHARSAINRRFRNLYEGTDWHGKPDPSWSLLAENPDGAGVCTACHAPTVGFSDPAFYDLRLVAGVDRHGVHCDYCHKVASVEKQGKIGITHGRFGLKLLRPAAGLLFFGPLDDVDRGEDSYSPLYKSSRYCASCHEGTIFGVHVYGTYSEWQQSPAALAGKQCQDCHMKPTGAMTNIAPGRGGISRHPQTLASHAMFVGSLEAMLRRSLNVAIREKREDGIFEVEIEARASEVGHRLPTGFPDRHLLLLVEATSAGRPVPLASGPILPGLAGPVFAGLPGKLFAKQLATFDGRTPAPFWLARPDHLDTRLIPGKPDRLAFRFDRRPDRVEVRVSYRRFWPEVSRQKGWPDDRINLLRVEWTSESPTATRASHGRG
jgi:hypothetical protein